MAFDDYLEWNAMDNSVATSNWYGKRIRIDIAGITSMKSFQNAGDNYTHVKLIDADDDAELESEALVGDSGVITHAFINGHTYYLMMAKTLSNTVDYETATTDFSADIDSLDDGDFAVTAKVTSTDQGSSYIIDRIVANNAGNVRIESVSTPADSVTVVTPNGGETLTVGNSYEITWTDTGTVGPVKIEFSSNNGGSYSTVVASTPNDGSYDWTVPDDKSALCLIKITDASVPAVTDTSDAVFTITGPPDQNTRGWAGWVQSWLIHLRGLFSTAIEASNSIISNYYPVLNKQITGDFFATVVKVHDGDTITLRTAFRDFDFPLRIANIDAPEMNAGGEWAREYLKSKILGKEVLVAINPKNRVGKYGRLIGEVFSGGFNVGEDMMRQNIVPKFGGLDHRIDPFSKLMKEVEY